jgi:ATP-dependent DNA helicase RecQ
MNSERSAGVPPVEISALNPRQLGLFAAFKAKRLELAKAQKMPPYVICGDRTLIEMALRNPRELDDLQRIHGFGSTKIERYGAIFLAVLKAHAQGD